MAYLKRWPHTYQKDTLTNWRSARANAASQPVDVVYYGNSLTQDGGSPTRFIEGGYPSHVGNWMNAKLGKQHGQGFDCARVTGNSLHWNYTNNSGQFLTYNPTGAFQPGTVGHAAGFGLWTCALVPTDVMTYTNVMDRFDILYIKTNTGGGTVEVRIDGVLQGSFNTLDASQTNTTLATFEASNIWTSSPLANGSHTVTLTNVGGDLAYIEGIFVYNTNYDTGFRIWNGAHSGYWGAYNRQAPNSYDIIKRRQPALAIWGHFFNDKNLPYGGPSSYGASAGDFISKVRQLSPNTDILLCTEWQCPGWGDATVAASYADMRNTVLYVAGINNVGVIDLGEHIGSVGYNGVFNDPFGWLKVDGTHQGSADGFLQWAKIHYAYLNDIKPPVRPQGY